MEGGLQGFEAGLHQEVRSQRSDESRLNAFLDNAPKTILLLLVDPVQGGPNRDLNSHSK